MDYEDEYLDGLVGEKVLIGTAKDGKIAGELLEHTEYAIWVTNLSGGSRMQYKRYITFIDKYDKNTPFREKNYNM